MDVKILRDYNGKLTGERPVRQGDILSLPNPRAIALIQKGAAERLDTVPEAAEPIAPILPYTPLARTPHDFTVVASMRVYNEIDVLDAVIQRAIAEGVQLVIYDNWSDDGSYELAERFVGQGVIALKRWPEQPSNSFSHYAYADFVTRDLLNYPSSWHMAWDADEYLRSPWYGVPYRDALHAVDQMGYTVVDHSYLDYWPTDDTFDSGDMVRHIKYYELRDLPLQRAWKAGDKPVTMARACHQVSFDGHKVCPELFILMNYRYRSSRQAKQKQQSRQERLRVELAKGEGAPYHRWPVDSSFIRKASDPKLHPWRSENWLSKAPFDTTRAVGTPESTWTRPCEWQPRPEHWHATDSLSTEHEVIDLVVGMVRALQPEVVIESGSYHGETAAAIGQALLRNGHGKCYAVENDAERAAAARERCAGLPVEVVEQDIVEFTCPDPVQFAWIDSSPKRLEHLQHVMSQCQVGAIVGIHDTAPHKEIGLRAIALPNITLRTPRGVTFVVVGDNNEGASEGVMDVMEATEVTAEPADNDTHRNTVDDATITHKATRRGRGRPRKYDNP